MLGLSYTKKTSLRYDYINKFCYKNTQQLPDLKKITLLVEDQTSEYKLLMAGSLVVKSLSTQEGVVVKSSASDVLLKIKKNRPVGVKVVLKKKLRIVLMEQLLLEIFPVSMPAVIKIFNKNSISLEILDAFAFVELDNCFKFFGAPISLKVTLTTVSQTFSETSFFFRGLGFSTRRGHNSVGRV